MGMRKVLSVLAVLVLVWVSLVPEAEAGGHSASANSGMIPFNVGAWLQLLRAKISQLKRAVEGTKRSCNGFPCMYTHLGSKAGKQARMMSLMSILNKCANDPKCSPGKRRRRSTSAQAVLAMLSNKRTSS